MGRNRVGTGRGWHGAWCWLRVAAAIGAVVLGTLATLVAAGATTLQWTVAYLDPVVNAHTAGFNGVSCAGTAWCVAAGDAAPSGSPSLPLIETWDGFKWEPATTPQLSGVQTATLTGASCASTSFCVAAGWAQLSSTGQSEAIVETWNGTGWSLSTPMGSNSYLAGVSCVSATSCLAVGSNAISPLAGLVWNGTSWTTSVVSPPALYDSFTGVACSSVTSCVAVGYDSTGNGGDAPLVETWNGSGWTFVSSPNPSPNSFLMGVSCVSASSCTAVGYQGSSDDATLVESYDGTTWSVVPSVSPTTTDASLDGVSCVSASSCVAVGRYFGANGYLTLIEQWDGGNWSLATSPNPSNQNFLYGVSCAAATWCAAVGNDGDGTGATVPLVETGTGATPTSTALSSNANPAVVGQPVTYTATVTPVPNGGSVYFSDNGVAVSGCSGVFIDTTTGRASCTVTYSDVSSHSVTAQYGGDVSFGSSTGGISETVDAAATSTTVSGNGSPSIVGQSVTFTARVSVLSPGSTAVSGQVEFLADGVDIAGCSSVQVSSNVATCGTASLGVGTHAITALYHGYRTTASSSGGTAQTVGYGFVLLYNSTTAIRAGSTVKLRVELQNASGADLSASNVTVTAVCVVLQPATTCASSLRTLNQAFSFSSKAPASYSFALGTKGLGKGSYSVVVAVAGDPTPHLAPFLLG